MDSFTYGKGHQLTGETLKLARKLYKDVEQDNVEGSEAVLSRLHEIASALQTVDADQRRQGDDLPYACNQGIGNDWLSLCADICNISQDEYLLFSASGVGNVDVVRGILEAGASVDVCNVNGYSPLSVAATVGNPDIVRLLLRHGADACIQNVEKVPLIEEVLDEITYSPLDGVDAGKSHMGGNFLCALHILCCCNLLHRTRAR